MDRLDAMKMFVRVAELGSFAAVAQQMGVARSVVTRQIAALEAHLGCKLMARSTRRLSLTSAGLAYLEKARVILNLVETAEQEVAVEQQTLRGQIRVSMPINYGMQRVAPLLLAFAQAHPLVNLEMDFTDRRQNLIEEGIDLSIRITRQLGPQDVARKLGRSRMLLIAAPTYLQKHGEPRRPEELSHHAWLGYTYSGTGSVTVQVEGVWQNIPVHSLLLANNGELLLAAARQGMGIACLPDFMVEQAIAEGAVQAVLPAAALPELGVFAVLPGNRQIPQRVRALIDALAAGLTS